MKEYLTGGGLVLVGTILSNVLNYRINKKNLDFYVKQEEEKREFEKKQEEEKRLYEKLEEILYNMEEDMFNFNYIMNNYKMFGKEKIDELGGYRRYLTKARALSLIYFPNLYYEIVKYERQLGNYFSITLSKGFKTSLKENNGDINERDIVEEEEIYKKYRELTEKIEKEAKKIKKINE